MQEKVDNTKNAILKSAKKEFLEKGFSNASLRTIASNAGLTTGAMYRHFKDKDSLLCALTDEVRKKTLEIIEKAGIAYHINETNPLGKEHKIHEKEILINYFNFVYDNFDIFTLILTKAEGSSQSNFLHEITDIYADNCIKLVNWLKDSGTIKSDVDNMTIHSIATNFIYSFTEIILHKMDKEEARNFIHNTQDFYQYGMMHILNVPYQEAD